MDVTPADRAQGLLSEARALLESGRPRDAALLFGRVLLQDPANEDARQGLVRARAEAGELERELEARLWAARESAAAGDSARARALLEDVIRLGGDRDRAHELLDRLAAREGRVPAPEPATPRGAEAAAGLAEPRPRRWWSRGVFAAACAAAFTAVTATVAMSWDHLLARLERRPSPAAYAASTLPVPEPPAGERALADARQRLDRGDVPGALSALREIRPDDPVYPFAVQLRQRAESAAVVPVAAGGHAR
jgi:hypothetical protein